MGISYVADATSPAFQAAKDMLIFTLPIPNLLPTRTVSWNRGPQHRSLITNSARTGGPPGVAGGNSRTAVGCTSLGMVLYSKWTHAPGHDPGVPTQADSLNPSSTRSNGWRTSNPIRRLPPKCRAGASRSVAANLSGFKWSPQAPKYRPSGKVTWTLWVNDSRSASGSCLNDGRPQRVTSNL